MITTTHTNSLSFVRADLSSHFQITALVYYYFQKKQTKEINLYFLFLPHTKTSIPHSLSFKQRYNNAKVDYDAKWQNWWVMGGIEMMSNCILAKLRMKTYYNNYPPNQREILMAFHLVIVVPSSPGGSPRLFSSIPLLMFRQFKFAHKLNSDPWINHFNDS